MPSLDSVNVITESVDCLYTPCLPALKCLRSLLPLPLNSLQQHQAYRYPHHILLYVVWGGFELQYSCLYGKPFASRAISSAPQATFLQEVKEIMVTLQSSNFEKLSCVVFFQSIVNVLFMQIKFPGILLVRNFRIRINLLLAGKPSIFFFFAFFPKLTSFCLFILNFIENP